MDSLTLAISQGSLRRGSAACYLDIRHPEIEEFLEIRKPSGDFNRKALNLHHGVLVYRRVHGGGARRHRVRACVSPKDGSVRATVDARSLFQKLVETRLATGEPYIVFSDTVNRMMPKHQRDLGLKVSTSNLCSEITLPTGRDHLGNDRTAVCCLSLAQPRDLGRVERRQDLHRGRDALPRQRAAGLHRPRARRRWPAPSTAAMRERSVGLGVMGFHSFLQAQGHRRSRAPMAKVVEPEDVQAHRGRRPTRPRMVLAQERGACPDADEQGVMERFSCKMAIAPTASISIICGGTAPASSRSRPTSTPTRRCRAASSVKNPYLEKLLATKSKDIDQRLELDPRERRLGPAPRLPQPGGEGRLQDQLRDRPALAARVRRPTARRTSTRRSRSTSSSPPTSTSGT